MQKLKIEQKTFPYLRNSKNITVFHYLDHYRIYVDSDDLDAKIKDIATDMTERIHSEFTA